MSKEEAFAVDGDAFGLAVYDCACLFGKPTERPYIVVANEEVKLYTLVGE